MKKSLYVEVQDTFKEQSLEKDGLNLSKIYLDELCKKKPNYLVSYKKAFFTIYKDSHTKEALEIIEDITHKEKNPAFIRVVAKKYQSIGNHTKAKNILKKIKPLSLTSVTNEFKRCQIVEEYKKKIQQLQNVYPNEEQKLFEYIFRLLKDSHKALAVTYGKKYLKHNPTDIKFAKVLINRMNELGLDEEMITILHLVLEEHKDKKLSKILHTLEKNFKSFNQERYKERLLHFSKDSKEALINYINFYIHQFPSDKNTILSLTFSLLKDTHISIAVQYGIEYTKHNPSNSKFAKVLLKRMKQLERIDEMIELLKIIVKKTQDAHFSKKLHDLEKKINHFNIKEYNHKLLLLSESSVEEFIEKILYKFPNKKETILSSTFVTLKDKYTTISVKYGLQYIQSNPKDIKFAKVLLKRMQQIKQIKESIECAKFILKHTHDTDLAHLVLNHEIKEKLIEWESLYQEKKYKQLRLKIDALIKKYKYNLDTIYANLHKFYLNKEYKKSRDYAIASLKIKNNNTLIKSLYDLYITYGHISKALSIIPPDTTHPTLLRKRKNGDSLMSLFQHGFDLVPQKQDQPYFPKKKKIFYLLHNRLPYNSGGYATRSHGLLTNVAKFGWEMNGVSRLGYPLDKMPDKPSQKEDTIDGITYHRLFHNDIGLGSLPLKEYLEEYAKSLLTIAKKERPSIIHAASNYMNGVVGNYVAKSLGIKSVYEVRGLWEITRISRQPQWKDSEFYNLMAKMEAQAAKDADIVFTLTNALKNEMITRGVDANKIHILPNGVTTQRFIPRERDSVLEEALQVKGKIIIGYIGSIVAYEGLELLVQAVKLLIEDNITNIMILIVGDGAVLDMIKEYVVNNQLEPYFIFTGRVPHEEVEKYYSLVDITPFPRKGQPVCEMVSPLKPFEAMAMSKAVVSSDVEALREIVKEGYNGLLFKKDNIQDLALKLKRLIQDENLRKKLGQQARQWVLKERDWKNISSILNDGYHQLHSEEK